MRSEFSTGTARINWDNINVPDPSLNIMSNSSLYHNKTFDIVNKLLLSNEYNPY